MESIKEVLMERDDLSKKDAENLIKEAQDQLHIYLLEEDYDAASNICEEYFGLEPDYIMDLI